jgi:hypothetical protein
MYVNCATTAKAHAWRTGQQPRRVGLQRGSRHQRHTAARQLPSRLDDHQRLRPPLRERLQQLLRRQRLRHRRPLHCCTRAASSGGALGHRLLPGAGPGSQQTMWTARPIPTSHHPIIFSSQTTIPMGPIATRPTGASWKPCLRALLNHEISFGKQDDWLGPGLGGGMAYSNNAENIYSFRINRIEPLHIPLLSRLTGPFRYEFLMGPLRGTLYAESRQSRRRNPNLPNVINPGDPWCTSKGQLPAHGKPGVRLRAHRDLGRPGSRAHHPSHLPEEAFSAFSARGSLTNGRNDPARALAPSTSLTGCPLSATGSRFYTDSEVHDDVSPVDAPRRAAYRPGLYLSHVPGIPKLDIRAEAADAIHSSSAIQPSTLFPANYGQFHVLGKFRSRATQTTASYSATGSDARTRAARPGSPII